MIILTENYWNLRYEAGGNSGKGSIGKYRKWIWKVIEETVGAIRYKTIIDVGCGDMTFWKLGKTDLMRKCHAYFGIDKSSYIIKENSRKYGDKKFLCGNAKDWIWGINAEIVLCISLLFHIMDDDEFEEILIRLCDYSKDWIIIYTWLNNPFEKYEGGVSDGSYQYFRNLMKYDDVFFGRGFELKKVMKIQFDDYGACYFYRRVIM